MAIDKGDKGAVKSNRKVADYLLTALKQSETQSLADIRKLVCLAQDELEKSAGKKPAA